MGNRRCEWQPVLYGVPCRHPFTPQRYLDFKPLAHCTAAAKAWHAVLHGVLYAGWQEDLTEWSSTTCAIPASSVEACMHAGGVAPPPAHAAQQVRAGCSTAVRQPS